MTLHVNLSFAFVITGGASKNSLRGMSHHMALECRLVGSLLRALWTLIYPSMYQGMVLHHFVGLEYFAAL